MIAAVLLATLSFPLAAQTPVRAAAPSPPAAATHSKAKSAASKAKPKTPARKKTRHSTAPALPGIAPERASEIQAALVSAGYLEKNTGQWDAAAAAAMKKYQADHHWQVRFVPDARALDALGLGPQPAAPHPASGG